MGVPSACVAHVRRSPVYEFSNAVKRDERGSRWRPTVKNNQAFTKRLEAKEDINNACSFLLLATIESGFESEMKVQPVILSAQLIVRAKREEQQVDGSPGLSEPACLDTKRASAPKHATTQRRSGQTCRMAGTLSRYRAGRKGPGSRSRKSDASQELKPTATSQPASSKRGQRFSKRTGEILAPRIGGNCFRPEPELPGPGHCRTPPNAFIADRPHLRSWRIGPPVPARSEG